jgi:hypothetical protein
MNDLQAKIAARNKLNSFIKSTAPTISDALKALLGKKVILGDGSLSKTAQKILNPIFESARPAFQIFKGYGGYTLYLTFKTSEPLGEFDCVYQESSVNFGKLVDGALTEVNELDPQYYPSDFSFEKVSATIREIEDLKDKARQLKSSICNFVN